MPTTKDRAFGRLRRGASTRHSEPIPGASFDNGSYYVGEYNAPETVHTGETFTVEWLLGYEADSEVIDRGECDPGFGEKGVYYYLSVDADFMEQRTIEQCMPKVNPTTRTVTTEITAPDEPGPYGISTRFSLSGTDQDRLLTTTIQVNADECNDNDNCADNELCIDGECVTARTECYGDWDCPRDQDCENNLCVEAEEPECSADSDCLGRAVCGQGGQCSYPDGVECSWDHECQDDEVCENGSCVVPTPECTADTDCTGDLVCQGEQCVRPGTGGPCVDDGACPSGQVCQGGECVEGGGGFGNVLIIGVLVLLLGVALYVTTQ